MLTCGSTLLMTSSPPGRGDKKIMSYNFRVCLTNNASNMVPLPKPEGYNPADFELLARYLAVDPTLHALYIQKCPGGHRQPGKLRMPTSAAVSTPCHPVPPLLFWNTSGSLEKASFCFPVGCRFVFIGMLTFERGIVILLSMSRSYSTRTVRVYTRTEH